MKPFIFANLALAPNRRYKEPLESWLSPKQIFKRYGRFSTGFGATYNSALVSVECYYNAWVNARKNEIVNDFQINIGID